MIVEVKSWCALVAVVVDDLKAVLAVHSLRLIGEEICGELDCADVLFVSLMSTHLLLAAVRRLSERRDHAKLFLCHLIGLHLIEC